MKFGLFYGCLSHRTTRSSTTGVQVALIHEAIRTDHKVVEHTMLEGDSSWPAMLMMEQ